jgi:2'-5' RNA ligase
MWGDDMEGRMKKCTLQVNLPQSIADEIKALCKSIPDEDLAGHGRDTGEPHVTIRWGIEEDTPETIETLKAACRSLIPFIARLGETNTFKPSVASDGAAVVYLTVKNESFKKLNGVVSKAVKCVDTFSYTPHVTVAYVKPELASKYQGNKSLNDREWIVSSLEFSNRDQEKTEIK